MSFSCNLSTEKFALNYNSLSIFTEFSITFSFARVGIDGRGKTKRYY